MSSRVAKGERRRLVILAVVVIRPRTRPQKGEDDGPSVRASSMANDTPLSSCHFCIALLGFFFCCCCCPLLLHRLALFILCASSQHDKPANQKKKKFSDNARTRPSRIRSPCPFRRPHLRLFPLAFSPVSCASSACLRPPHTNTRTRHYDPHYPPASPPPRWTSPRISTTRGAHSRKKKRSCC